MYFLLLSGENGRRKCHDPINTVRLAIQDDEQEWFSERMIRAGMYTLPQTEGETRHIPDGILRTDDGDFVIEVELTQKKPDELYRKMYALIHAWDKEAFAYAYTGIWYYTPDKHIANPANVP